MFNFCERFIYTLTFYIFPIYILPLLLFKQTFSWIFFHAFMNVTVHIVIYTILIIEIIKWKIYDKHLNNFCEISYISSHWQFL